MTATRPRLALTLGPVLFNWPTDRWRDFYARIGVAAFKIEGRQRGRAYAAAVVRAFRNAVDSLAAGTEMDVGALRALTEGQRDTTGAYRKAWR